MNCRLFFAFMAVLMMLFVSEAKVCGMSWDGQRYQPEAAEVIFYDFGDCKPPWYTKFSSSDFVTMDQWKNMTDLKTSDGKSWNDRVSCLIVGPKAKLKVWQHTNKGGKSKEFTPQNNQATMYQLSTGDKWWNNTISSFTIGKMPE